jgi:hypothetical protein
MSERRAVLVGEESIAEGDLWQSTEGAVWRIAHIDGEYAEVVLADDPRFFVSMPLDVIPRVATRLLRN